MSPPSGAGALAALAACGSTIALYAFGRWLHRRVPTTLTLPVVVATLGLIAALTALRLDVGAYVSAARPLSFWLGPATVALAIPVHREWPRMVRHRRAIVFAVVSGAIVSVASVLACGLVLHASPTLVRSLVPKSVTTPIAMPIAARLGGVPELTAAVVIVTGLLGMAFGSRLLDWVGVRDPVARGLALGTAAHGIGTARALEEGPLVGAMAGVAMVVSGVTTAIVAPLIVR